MRKIIFFSQVFLNKIWDKWCNSQAAVEYIGQLVIVGLLFVSAIGLLASMLYNLSFLGILLGAALSVGSAKAFSFVWKEYKTEYKSQNA